MSLRLTEEMIIRKAKGNFSIGYIKNLKFFNSFLNDISIVSQCKSIESATFSKNNISSLMQIAYKPKMFIKLLSDTSKVESTASKMFKEFVDMVRTFFFKNVKEKITKK